MKKHYYIDGNNLIGKMPRLWELQKKDKQGSREKLAAIVDRYFAKLPHKTIIFFDGYKNDPIPTSKISIRYCDNRTADEDIKTSIMQAKNPKHIIVVSSDHSVMQFAQKSSCKVIKSEKFASALSQPQERDSESNRIEAISNDEIKKMFGV